MPSTIIHEGDCRQVLDTLPAASVHTVITSPPYWGLRDYGVAGQLGLEATPEEYVSNMVAVFRAAARVLRDDGTLWLNLGDSYVTRANGSVGASTLDGSRHAHTEYRRTNALRSGAVPAGLKHKDLVGIPWRVALALQADGWYLRSDIIWHKPNPMPESVTDRPTKAHEYIFLLTKGPRYFYDAEAVKEEAVSGKGSGNGFKRPQRLSQGGRGSETPWEPTESRNRRTVWTVQTEPFPDAHFATFPPDLIEPCILAGTSSAGCCPTCGAPHLRDVETFRTVDGERCEDLPSMRTVDRAAPSGAQGVGHGRIATASVTKGWLPTCNCEAAPVPCTVLDPFNGAGTTGLVANRHGRNYVGIELNPTYADMARRRITRDNPLFNSVTPA